MERWGKLRNKSADSTWGQLFRSRNWNSMTSSHLLLNVKYIKLYKWPLNKSSIKICLKWEKKKRLNLLFIFVKKNLIQRVRLQIFAYNMMKSLWRSFFF